MGIASWKQNDVLNFTRCAMLISTWLLIGTSHSTFAESPSKVELPPGFQSRVFVDEQGSHAYTVYIPKGKMPPKGWPIVLFLHGAGERGVDGLLPASVGLGTALEQTPQPFIAVIPQSESLQERYLRGWEAGLSDAERALKILAEVERAERVDSSKRILCGWSMGGYGTWSVAAAQPEKWSAVLALSGGAIAPLDLHQLAKTRTPVWAIHGKNDELIPAEHSKKLIDQLQAEQGVAHLSLVHGVGHDVWRYVFAQPEIFQWMLDPKLTDLSTIEFNATTPLPERSRFYAKQFSSVSTVQDAMSLRLGNDALLAISQSLPNSISETLLQGSLDDIDRRLTVGETTIHVKLQDIHWSCALSHCKLRAISGGRFKASFGLKPMTFKIKKPSLHSNDVSATMSEINIVIGHQFPEVLELELQPSMVNGKLKLTLLRNQFAIAENNWFIQHPTNVEVQSKSYTKYHVVTGLVGGLYQQRAVIEEQVLNAVPEFLTYLEDELQSHNAPQLAQMLWPLPVLVPELLLSPSQVRTDKNGISVVLNLKSISYGPNTHAENFSVSNSFHVRQISPVQSLATALSLSVVEPISQSIVRNQIAQINVLDLPNQSFQSLVDEKLLAKLFPACESPRDVQAMLQLNGPFRLEQTTDSIENLRLSAPQVAVAYSLRTSTGKFHSLGTFHFALSQSLSLQLKSSHLPATVEVQWSPHALLDELQFETCAEKSANSSLVEATTCGPAEKALFEETFLSAWDSWSVSQSHDYAAPEFSKGDTELHLKTLTIDNNQLQLEFSPSTMPGLSQGTY